MAASTIVFHINVSVSFDVLPSSSPDTCKLDFFVGVKNEEGWKESLFPAPQFQQKLFLFSLSVFRKTGRSPGIFLQLYPTSVRS